jgi:uncharacterized membrane protein
MIGAAPMPPLEAARHRRLADAMSHALSLASASFNDGLRNYYFGFATLGWLVHPLLVPLTMSLIVAMLLRRQLSSATASSVALVLADLDLAERPGSDRLRGLL